MTLTIFFDGSCPFCDRYADYLALKRLGDVKIKNARDYPEDIELYKKQGHDINKGMIVQHHTTIYHGSDAVLYLQYMISGYAFFNNTWIRLLARPFYTCINFIRRCLLWIMGKKGLM